MGSRIGLCCALALLWVLGCGDETPEPPAARAELMGDSALVAHFFAAERDTGVPAALLATIAYVQTRLEPPRWLDGASGHAPREWGLMAIGTGGLTTLEQAAERAGLTPAEVASDARANVRAAALLLADAHGASGDRDWRDALEAYGGDALAGRVQRLMADGWRSSDSLGRSIEVVGHGLRPGLGKVAQALGYPGAIWSPASSSNYTNASRGAGQIDYVVIHTTQGSYAGTISWFKNPSAKVSAHYVVRSADGEVTQMVDDADIAWHDGCFNSHSIGIEHEGFVQDPGKWYTDAMYAASAKLTAWLCDTYGIPKDRQHIMGHSETPDCSDHTDPGSGWNWDKYMQLVASGGATAQNCSQGQADACGNFGCWCVDGQCNGGYCPGSGCTAQDAQNCAAFGCQCVDGQCNGGYCPGPGCTAKEQAGCAKFGCGCVDHQCSGGFCPGSGCTALDQKNCGAFGCNCVDGKCGGGFCEGSGCTAKEQTECQAKGCGCVDHQCSGGACQGSGCTAKQTLDCEKQGKACDQGACADVSAGGSGGGSGATGGGPSDAGVDGAAGWGSGSGSGGGGSGGSAGGARTPPDVSPAETESGCACRAGGPRGSAPASAALLSLMTALLVRRQGMKRRHRFSNTQP